MDSVFAILLDGSDGIYSWRAMRSMRLSGAVRRLIASRTFGAATMRRKIAWRALLLNS